MQRTIENMNVLNWNVWIRPMIEHLFHLLSMPIYFSCFIYFEGESMLNVLGSLLINLTKGRTKTHHKIIIHAFFLVEWLLKQDISSLVCINFKFSHCKSKFYVYIFKCK
jgi:hypothetical protein